MGSPGGSENPPLTQALMAARLVKGGPEFEFFQAIRVLERVLPDRAPVGLFLLPSSEVVRFVTNTEMGFPASEIQSIEIPESGPVRMMVNFMGLTGPSGTLPTYYTEMVRERLRSKDHAIAAFFDLFNHRIISLFFQAWLKYRFNISYERAAYEGNRSLAAAREEEEALEDEVVVNSERQVRDRFSHHLLDLIGLGTKGLQNRLNVADDSLLYFSGLLSMETRSASALRNLLIDYFAVPVEVEQFVGAWYPLTPETQCGFDHGDTISEQLGIGAVLGDEVWDQQSGVRLKLGPLTLRQYLDFLPNGTAHAALRALTRFFAGNETDFDVQLILKHDEVPQCELGATNQVAPQLGWLSWAKTREMSRQASDTILKI
jgi:type VI secretion system protein ImpH